MKPSRRLALAVLPAALALCSCAHKKQPEPVAAPVSNKPVMGAITTPRGLTLQISETPDPLKLGENRQVAVIVGLKNNGKNAAKFHFTSTQEIEILLRDPETGKTVSAWSADRTFDQVTRYVVVNPKERLEFNEPLTTRDLKPGKTYTLEAYVVGYDKELRVSRPLIPQP